jgi:proteasome lid subunit RPN8/RPN11
MFKLLHPQELQLSTMLWGKMRAQAEQQAPEEACGLLAGEIGAQQYRAHSIMPTTNALHSRVRYRIDPLEQLKAFEHIEELGWELVGIYHSHPNGPDAPSPTDVSEAYYPEAVYLIWSHRTGEWNCRGFLIQDGNIDEVTLTICEQT